VAQLLVALGELEAHVNHAASDDSVKALASQLKHALQPPIQLAQTLLERLEKPVPELPELVTAEGSRRRGWSTGWFSGRSEQPKPSSLSPHANPFLPTDDDDMGTSSAAAISTCCASLVLDDEDDLPSVSLPSSASSLPDVPPPLPDVPSPIPGILEMSHAAELQQMQKWIGAAQRASSYTSHEGEGLWAEGEWAADERWAEGGQKGSGWIEGVCVDSDTATARAPRMKQRDGASREQRPKRKERRHGIPEAPSLVSYVMAAMRGTKSKSGEEAPEHL
jgi:hypothetical protein